MEQPISSTAAHAPLDLAEAEELCNSLKRITVRSEEALQHGDATDGIAKIERWVESYRRGLEAAAKISDRGIELLKKTREQLALALSEQLRIADEGGIAPSKEQLAQTEELSKAVRHIDELLTLLETNFQPADTNSNPEAA